MYIESIYTSIITKYIQQGILSDGTFDGISNILNAFVQSHDHTAELLSPDVGDVRASLQVARERLQGGMGGGVGHVQE